MDNAVIQCHKQMALHRYSTLVISLRCIETSESSSSYLNPDQLPSMIINNMGGAGRRDRSCAEYVKSPMVDRERRV